MIKNTSYSLKKWMFGFVAFVAVFIAETALLTGTSRFLSNGLIGSLPVLLFLVSLAAIINFVFNLLLSRKLSAGGSFIVSLFLMMALIVLCFYLKENLAAYLFLSLLIARLGFVVFDTSITNLASSYVNPRQARAFLPFIRGVMDFGLLFASIYVYFSSLNSLPLDPLWVMLIGVGLMAVAVIAIVRIFEPLVGDDYKTPESEKIGFKDGLKQSMSFVFQKSKLFYYLTWLFVLFGGIAVLYVYVYNEAFGANLYGEELTRFMAIVNFVAVFSRGVFDFVILKRGLYRLGVANLLLIYPWVMFVLSSLLMLSFQNLYLAAALYIFHVFSYYSYVTVVTQAMFGLTPRDLNQTVYFFIKGVAPAVSALGAAFLMGVALMVSGDRPIVVGFMLLLVVAASLRVALNIKREYQSELLKAVDGQDHYLKGNSVELMGEKIQQEKGEKLLRKLAVNSNESVELRQKALTSLVEIGNPNSIREFLLILEGDKNFRLRYYAVQAINRVFEKMDKKRFGSMSVTKLLMIDVFNKVYLEDLPLPVKLEVNQALKMFGFDVLLDFYKRHFVSSPDYIKASIIEALAVAEDRGLITLLEPYLDSNDLGIRSAAISGLWRFEEMRDMLMTKMIEIFSSKEDKDRMASLKLISQLKLRTMEDYVLDLVAVPNRELSAMAVITSINLGKGGGLKVLVRKLVKAAMVGDQVMVEFIFKKFYLLSEKSKNRFVSEIKALSSANFDRLKEIFTKSDKYFDLVLATLFTS